MQLQLFNCNQIYIILVICKYQNGVRVDDQFNLSKVNQNSDLQYNLIDNWRNEVQHLSIRKAFDSYITSNITISILSANSIFSQQNPSQQQKIQFRKDLRRLKEYIEDSQRDQIVCSIVKYIKSSTSYEEGSKRLKILKQILRQAQKYCKQKQIVGNNNYLQYGYLKEFKLSVFEQKALLETIRCGFFVNQTLKFSISPQQLVNILCNALKDKDFSTQIAKLIKDLLVNHRDRNLNAEFRRFLDRVSYPIFVDGNFDLHYLEYKVIDYNHLLFQEAIVEPATVMVSQTCPIIGYNNTLSSQPSQVFKRIIKLADDNEDKYVGGYPVEERIKDKKDEKQNNNKEPQLKNFTPLENNMLFDNIVLKKIPTEKSSKALYDMILYDWTMGRPQSKSAKDFRSSIEKYFNNSKIKGDVNCKLLIVAQDFLVKDYFDSWKNKTNKITSINQVKLGQPQKMHKYKKNRIVFEPAIPQIYLSYSFENQIQEISYMRNITVGLASFDFSSPFRLQQSSKHTILVSFVAQSYKQLSKIENKKLFPHHE